MATPNSVQFSTNPVEATQAESELVIFRSELSEYNPSSNKHIRINLPVAPKSWLDWSDSILSLKFTNRSFDSASASTSESAVKTELQNLIRSITVLNSQGQVTEYINNYNLITNVLNDYTMSESHKKSTEAVLAGGSPDGNPANSPEVAGSASTAEADGTSLTLSDKLVSGFTSGQYLLPLGYLVGTAAAIILELEDAATALKINTAANNTPHYKVSEVQLRCKQIRFNEIFNESFERTLAEAGSVGINYITETFIHAQNSIPASTTGVTNVPFSMNPRSAKYILAVGRLETDVALKSAYSLGNRSSYDLVDYNFEINGKQMITQPIPISATNYANAYSNVLDCFGVIGALNHSNLITTSTAGSRFYSATQATAQKFISGIVLEDFNSATNSSVYSGMNLSNASAMSYRPQIGSTGTSAAYRVDMFCSADCSYHFTADGRMYSVK